MYVCMYVCIVYVVVPVMDIWIWIWIFSMARPASAYREREGFFKKKFGKEVCGGARVSEWGVTVPRLGSDGNLPYPCW